MKIDVKSLSAVQRRQLKSDLQDDKRDTPVTARHYEDKVTRWKKAAKGAGVKFVEFMEQAMDEFADKCERTVEKRKP